MCIDAKDLDGVTVTPCQVLLYLLLLMCLLSPLPGIFYLYVTDKTYYFLFSAFSQLLKIKMFKNIQKLILFKAALISFKKITFNLKSLVFYLI